MLLAFPTRCQHCDPYVKSCRHEQLWVSAEEGIPDHHQDYVSLQSDYRVLTLRPVPVRLHGVKQMTNTGRKDYFDSLQYSVMHHQPAVVGHSLHV